MTTERTPYFITKGTFFRAAEKVLRDPAQAREALDVLLSDDPDLTALADKQGLLASTAEAAHFREAVFGNWWPELQPIQPIIARGFQEALRESLERGLPLDIYLISWEPVEAKVVVLTSEQQVTVIAFLPRPPTFTYRDPTDDPNIKVIEKVAGEVRLTIGG
jgi:hypothetical protein